MKNRILILFSVILILTSGCIVSKKKYEAAMLENSRLNKQLTSSEKENNKLENKLEGMISEFEQMKNDLHLSNAVKSDEMSELLVKVTQLSDLNTKLQNNLDETLNLYKSQKQTSLSANNELEKLGTDIQLLRRDTASIKYALKLSKERFDQLKKEFETLKGKYDQVALDKQKATKELSINQQKLSSFEQQLIQNKEKMEDISKALIELRKDMLSAKSNNTPIDPNKNKYIDKMAQELGHY
jgi:chromosome segregation ATPase